MEEEFRIIPEFPMYRVSNFGNVESMLSGEWKPRKLKRVNKGTNHGGRIYLGFNVKVPNETLPSGQPKKKTLLVHTEVAKLFLGPRPPGMGVLHRDDDRDNNRLDNLMYGNQSVNMKMAIKNGKTQPYIKRPDGKLAGSGRT